MGDAQQGRAEDLQRSALKARDSGQWLEAKMADEKQLREAVERRQQHVFKLINLVEDIHWKGACTQTCL